MKILIVEDEVLIREGMSDYLMECGYEVFEAGDGQEALDLFHREAPDLVLLDSDPLQDINAVQQVAGVFRRGEYYDPDMLARLRENRQFCLYQDTPLEAAPVHG